MRNIKTCYILCYKFWLHPLLQIVCNLSLKVSVEEAEISQRQKFPLFRCRQQITLAAGFAFPSSRAESPKQQLSLSVQTAEIKLSFRVKSINPFFPVRLHQESCARRRTQCETLSWSRERLYTHHTQERAREKKNLSADPKDFNWQSRKSSPVQLQDKRQLIKPISRQLQMHPSTGERHIKRDRSERVYMRARGKGPQREPR